MSAPRSTEPWRALPWVGRSAPEKPVRVTVGLGYLFRLLAWLNWPGVARFLMRRPWHIADELRDGTWHRIVAFPKTMSPSVEEINRAAERKAVALRLPDHEPKRVKLTTVNARPGLKLWQLRDGRAVQVQVRRTGAACSEADLDLRSRTVWALNEKNAIRKLTRP
jgi:hypothetical protein